MTSAFVLAAIGAFRLLKGSNHIYHKKALFLTMKLGFVFSVATALLGDFSGKYLAEYQPEKLAAAEWHFETGKGVPLILYGVLDNGEVKYALKIPFALSILAHEVPNAEVIGLDQFPKDEVPPLYIHYLFDTMVTIGMWMTVLVFGVHNRDLAPMAFRFVAMVPLAACARRSSFYPCDRGRMVAGRGRPSALGPAWNFANKRCGDDKRSSGSNVGFICRALSCSRGWQCSRPLANVPEEHGGTGTGRQSLRESG